MGLAAAGPKAILGPSRDKTQLNIFSLDVTAQPDPISIYLKTK